MKKLLISTVLPLSIMASNVDAAAPQPQRCPRASEISSLGVSQIATEESNDFWFTGRRSQFYGTSSPWTFLISKIPATSVDDAVAKATNALNSLTFSLGPVQGPFGTWICYYQNSPGYMATAINPPMAQNAEKPFLNLKK